MSLGSFAAALLRCNVLSVIDARTCPSGRRDGYTLRRFPTDADLDTDATTQMLSVLSGRTTLCSTGGSVEAVVPEAVSPLLVLERMPVRLWVVRSTSC